MARIAIVGEGVVGISTAVAIQKRLPTAKITVFHHVNFEETCSFGPAGLFRIDNVNWQKNRNYGKLTFDWYEELCRSLPGSKTGVKLLSGHIQSDDETSLKTQQMAYGDIVYNFRWLTPSEIEKQFPNPSKYCIQFSSYAAEGNLYVRFLRGLLQNVTFIKQRIESLSELGNTFDVVVNCAGLEAGTLAGDDNSVIPIRGIVVLVEAPWHKQFLYRDFSTFSIPKQNVVAIGSVKTEGDYRRDFYPDEVKQILDRYYQLQPAMKDAPALDSWCHLRPFRSAGIRVDSLVRKSQNGRLFSVVNHYGHGGAGFTLAYGSAQEAAELVEKCIKIKNKL